MSKQSIFYCIKLTIILLPKLISVGGGGGGHGHGGGGGHGHGGGGGHGHGGGGGGGGQVIKVTSKPEMDREMLITNFIVCEWH